MTSGTIWSGSPRLHTQLPELQVPSASPGLSVSTAGHYLKIFLPGQQSSNPLPRVALAKSHSSPSQGWIAQPLADLDSGLVGLYQGPSSSRGNGQERARAAGQVTGPCSCSPFLLWGTGVPGGSVHWPHRCWPQQHEVPSRRRGAVKMQLGRAQRAAKTFNPHCF